MCIHLIELQNSKVNLIELQNRKLTEPEEKLDQSVTTAGDFGPLLLCN